MALAAKLTALEKSMAGIALVDLLLEQIHESNNVMTATLLKVNSENTEMLLI